mmetsp:Transcript_12394/g.16273  ORF Transcript_12394/g.16273 Transcript_12394/m.16273 type:complete len:170 (+) Transcript_12394:69-578(+)
MLNKDDGEEAEGGGEQPPSNFARNALFGVAGAAAVVATGGLALTLAGFGAGGIVSGSIAAGIQSGIGNVAAGSLFAAAQGAGATGAIASMTVGATATAATAGVTAVVLDKKKNMARKCKICAKALPDSKEKKPSKDDDDDGDDDDDEHSICQECYSMGKQKMHETFKEE